MTLPADNKFNIERAIQVIINYNYDFTEIHVENDKIYRHTHTDAYRHTHNVFLVLFNTRVMLHYKQYL